MNERDMYDVLWWLANEARGNPIYHQRPKINPDIDGRFLEFFRFVLEHARAAHGQVFQDLWVLWELRRKRSGYFVEFGATDGISGSNTYLLETAYGWRGIVAEPNPMWHERLLRSRGCNVSLKCVYSHSGLSLPFKCCTEPELSTLALIDPADFFTTKRASFREVTVETVSLTDLLAEHGAPTEVDYLSIDTEGSEFDILHAHDFDRYRFKLVSVEHNGTFRREKIYDLLQSCGYRRVFEGYSLFDDWYI